MTHSHPKQQFTICYDDELYTVSAGQTILAALEAAGRRFVRGVGCRGGVCGACTVLYRMGDHYQIRAALMCQELVQEGMTILPLPWFPQKQMRYPLTLGEGESAHYRVVNLYPEVNRCIMCGECSRLCPVGLDVMGYVGMIKRGDLKQASRSSFTCVQCQACTLRCPAQIPQPNAALAARLFHARHQRPEAEHLTRMLQRLEQHDFTAAFRHLRRMDQEELQALYQSREREPDDTAPGTWLPEDDRLLEPYF
ncbi:MAG: 4Fe-4S dicluster domain-containing protein [Magnetococcales bacterium]|nr:4Fe-4S dicluster domain-containing protein [Magnetococcales bacterium]